MIALVRLLRDRFSRKIQFRLTLYFLFILLPLVLVSLYAIEKSRSIIYDQAVDRTEVALSSAMDYIDLTLQNVEEISTLLATDPGFIKLLNNNGSDLSPKAIMDFSGMLKQLSNVNSVNHIVSQISLYHVPSRMIISTGFGGRRLSSQLQHEWMVNAARNNGTGIRYVLADEAIKGAGSFGDIVASDSISLLRSMDLYNVDRKPNLLVITINKNKLISVMKTLISSKGANVFLQNDSGRTVAGTGNTDGSAGLPVISDKEMTVSIDSKYSNWRLTLIQPKEDLFKETNQLRIFTYIIIGISVLLALGISWVVYSGIASPVHKLSRGMKQLGIGKLNFQLTNNRKDEFGFLIDAFNQMVMYQKHLIEDHYEQQLRMTKTELKFLQSQINPHFLYNTLDSIYWSAKNYEADEISDMVMNLSKFFRLSLNKGQEVFTIEESIAHLHYYIRIQQIRFLENFTVDYQLQAETTHIPILKLLLQPLVENAIIHGMEGREYGGKLLVSSWIEDSHELRIKVSDNGSGMDSDRLLYIQHELDRFSKRNYQLLSKEEDSVKDLFGLRNVITRMKLYYGAEAELVIESSKGEGTGVTIILPLERCREDLGFKTTDLNIQEEGEQLI